MHTANIQRVKEVLNTSPFLSVNIGAIDMKFSSFFLFSQLFFIEFSNT